MSELQDLWEELGDPPLTPVHHQYLKEFDRWLRADDDARPGIHDRMTRLLELMRFDIPT